MKGIAYLVKNYFFLSLIVSCLTLFTYLSTASLPDYGFILSTGIATFILYNFYGLFSFNIAFLKKNWTDTNLKIVLFSMVLSSLVLLFNVTFIEFIVFSLAGILALAYFKPLPSQRKSLRDFLWLKPITIATVFAIVTATIPYHQGGYSWYESILLSLGRFFFVASIAIIFDISDVEEDHLQKVKTIPQVYGTNNAKMVASIFLMLAALIEGYGAWTFLLEVHGIVSLLFTYMIAWTLILFASDRRSWWYYMVLVDGAMGLPVVFFWVL